MGAFLMGAVKDEFASSDVEESTEHADKVEAAQEKLALMLGEVDDPWLRKFHDWERKIADATREEDLPFRGDIGKPHVTVRRKADTRVPMEPRLRESAKEGIVFDPRWMTVPKGDGVDAVTLYNAEKRYSGQSPYQNARLGETVVGIGSTNLRELWRACSWMMTHNPLAANVVRALTYLTFGEGINVNWPSSRNGSGDRKEKNWNEKERRIGFQQYVRRKAANIFGFGEWFTMPVYDPRKAKRGDDTTPNRLLSFEPDRISRIFVNDIDTDDVFGYEVGGASGAGTFFAGDKIVHGKIGQVGNVPRGLTLLMPALKYLRYAELFIESRHNLNLIRSRMPLIRQVKGGTERIQAEKNRIRKLPPPATIIVDSADNNWQMPELHLGSSDAREDWNLIILCIAAAVGLPAYMVANDVSQGNYASTLLTSSPTVRMVRDYREQALDGWVNPLIRACSGYDDGFTVTSPPVLRQSIGESAGAYRTMVESKIISRQTACEELGYVWGTDDEESDGEYSRILAEAGEGFDDLGPMGDAGGTGGEEPPMPGERPPDPKMGAAMGATGSAQPKKSAV